MLKAVPAGGVPEVTIKLFAGPAVAGGAVRSCSALDDGDDGAEAGEYMHMEDRMEVLREDSEGDHFPKPSGSPLKDHRGSDGSSSGESGDFGRQPSSGLGFGLLRKSSSMESFDTFLASRSQRGAHDEICSGSERPQTSSRLKPSWLDTGEGANESPQYVCFLARGGLRPPCSNV